MASSYEKRKCLEIMNMIDEHIPRGYVNKVKDVFENKGKKKPTTYQIQNTRAKRQFNLEIVKALAEISQPRDEDGNLIPPKKYRSGIQMSAFEPAKQ